MAAIATNARFRFRPAGRIKALMALAFLLSLRGEAGTIISLPDPNLIVPAGVTDTNLRLKVHVQGDGAEQAPTVTDLTPSSVVPWVKVEGVPEGTPANASANDWYFQLTAGKIPAKLRQERQIKITVAGTSQILSYILTNQSFTWTVKTPSPTWSVRDGTGRTLQVGAVEGPATRAHIAFCLLWGLGFPAAGAQLSQLTPSSIATTLKIPVVP
jgi:hypothetical protein